MVPPCFSASGKQLKISTSRRPCKRIWSGSDLPHGTACHKTWSLSSDRALKVEIILRILNTKSAEVLVHLMKSVAIIDTERLKKGVWRAIMTKCMKLVPLMTTIISLSLIAEIGEITILMGQEMITISTDSVQTATFTAAVLMTIIAIVPLLHATNLESVHTTPAQLSQDQMMKMMRHMCVLLLKSNISSNSKCNSLSLS